ncbi:flagellar export chaperone FliS [Pandoraea nosoerga]|uniref:Flagellar export chaperone FliS n=1 Tax=Pandoraea nosoerga TaxID=2508296 RepID=A0A5E4WD90_9BURK|nr:MULTISPECIES: flagellar export chaperone FliS [Pandoraea]MBN4667380.1 flagellar export chaperone FliS [Pandoraea nosoerga]MBN4677304.1 flagellar export chaperone FliS [Pandoraea nosoerga]MBN4682425.1 flagellar export chaperone FliS [Pandoraea nosoerga]MBN4746778.1 flagellar export chaperone FliS [Pandoraea nosoerga]VVE22538.1 flagellar export chaperone FliS [Pandoraea nosoerga]
MTYQRYLASDLDARIAGATPLQLMLILLDGLRDELARARAHIEHARHEARLRSVTKCLNLLNGLASHVDAADGPGVTQPLAKVYEFCMRAVAQASVESDVAKLDEVTAVVTQLADGWRSLETRRG